MEIAIDARFKNGKIFRAMMKRGWTQKQVAELVGHSQTAVGNFIKMKTVPLAVKLYYFGAYMTHTYGEKQVAEIGEWETLCECPIEDIFPRSLIDNPAAQHEMRRVEFIDVDPAKLLSTHQQRLLESPVDLCEKNLRDEALNEALSTLTERERKVVRLRFGFDGPMRTLVDTAVIFNCSRERVRQIETKALNKLRHPSRREKLMKFMKD